MSDKETSSGADRPSEASGARLPFTEQVVLREMERANRLSALDAQRLRLQQRSLRSSTWLTIALWVVLAVGGLGLATAWYAYRSTFSGGTTYDAGAWGQAGDFIGGVTNPVLTFLSLIALVLTVKLQSDQLNVARDDHELSRRRDQEDADREDKRQVHEKLVAEAQRSAAEAQMRAAQALERQVRLTALISRLESTRAGLANRRQILSRFEARRTAGNLSAEDSTAFVNAQSDWLNALERVGRLVDEIEQLSERAVETERSDSPHKSEEK